LIIKVLKYNFEYDPLYRVISADGRESDTQHENDYLYSDAPAPGSPNANNVRAYTRKYAFDRIGNVQQVKQLGANGFTRNFSYDAGYNTLQKVETPAPSLIEDFTYDACGNQITAGTTRNYVWNAGNQLITYYNQAGSADPTIFAQYDYSGMNRVSKLVRTGTSANPIYERTVYIDGFFEYHILENGTTFEKNYVHVMDDQSRIAMVRIGDLFPDDIADAVTYNLEDQIGSSVARLDINGTIIDREEYYPFGDSSLRTFTKKRYRYVGKEKDLESGLYYYGARYYAAWTCRFISIDPLAADYMHLTPYNYAGNKPINSVDIDGMQGENETQSAGGAVADLNPVGPPPGADLGDVFTDQQGKEWLFEQFENDPGGKWYPTITNLKESPSPVVIENDKYYRPTANGYIESGLVYSDAIKGSDLIQKMNEWQVQAEKHAELSAMERYAKYEAAAQKQAVYEYNRSQNLFGVIYMVFADPAVQTVKKAYNGQYAALSAEVAIAIFLRGMGGGSSNILLNTSKKLQAKFKHAGDFGIVGTYNKINATKYSAAINQHINSSGTRIITGTYRGQSVIHYVNPKTGLNVISSPSGHFISGWKLNPVQLQNVLNHGGL